MVSTHKKICVLDFRSCSLFHLFFLFYNKKCVIKWIYLIWKIFSLEYIILFLWTEKIAIN